MIEMLATSLTVRAIGWALLQSIWQGAVVCGVTAIVLLALRRRTAHARYTVACVGLVLMVAVPVFTAADYLRELRTSDGEQQQFVERSRIVAANTASRTMPNAALAPFPPAVTAAREGGRNEPARVSIWPAAAVLIWVAGVLLLSLRLFRSWLIVERIRRTAVQPVPETWQARVKAMADRLRIMRPVRIVESSLVETPIVIGWLRPVIL